MAILEIGTSSNTSGGSASKGVFVVTAIGAAIEEQLGCCVGDEKPGVVVGLWIGDNSLFLADKTRSLDGDMVAAGSNFGTEGRVVGGGELIKVREAERFLQVAEPNLYKVSGGGGGGGGSCGDVREGDLVLTGKNALCGGEDGPSLWEGGTGGGEREGDFIFFAFGKAMWGGTISLFTGLLGLFKPEGR